MPKRVRHNGQAPYFGANVWRMSTRTMHIALFPFRYRRDYAITCLRTVFLRRIPTPTEPCEPFLTTIAPLSYTAHCVPSTQPTVPLLCRYYQLALQWRKEIVASRTSGAILHRHCEQLNYLNQVSFVWRTNDYS